MTNARITRPGAEPVELESNASLEKHIHAYDPFQVETRYLEFGNAYGACRVTLEANADDNRQRLAQLGGELVIAMGNNEPIEAFLARAVATFHKTALVVAGRVVL